MEAQSPDVPIGDAIATSRVAFQEALRVGDAAAMAAMYAADATLVAPATDIVHGRAAIERFWRTGVATGVESVELTPLEVQRVGDLALEVGRYVLRVALETGALVVDRGSYLVVHQSVNDRWERVAEMLSPERSTRPEST